MHFKQDTQFVGDGWKAALILIESWPFALLRPPDDLVIDQIEDSVSVAGEMGMAFEKRLDGRPLSAPPGPRLLVEEVSNQFGVRLGNTSPHSGFNGRSSAKDGPIIARTWNSRALLCLDTPSQ
jgi:hypothetical protein